MAALSVAELEALIRFEPETDEGRTLRGRVIAETLVRRHRLQKPRHGRCPLLTWYTQSERILSPAELSAALTNYQQEVAA
jgi:hypothetical protein